MGSLAKKIFSSGSHLGSKHSYHTGMYYNYNYRPNKYSSINGDVCINNYNFDGIVYGQFICPVEGFDYGATKCCGEIYQQYCCTSDEFSISLAEYDKSNNNNNNNNNNYASTTVPKKTSSSTVLAITITIVVIAAVLTILTGVIVICVCKKRIYNRVPETVK